MYVTLHYIEENLKEQLETEFIAKVAGYSPSHFCRLFSIYVGMPVKDYVRFRRLIHAATAIKNGAKIIDTALDYGFETHGGFVKAFKREFGCVPAQYKKLNLDWYETKPIPNNHWKNKKGEILLTPKIMNRPAFSIAGYILQEKTGFKATHESPAFYDNNEEILVVDGTRVETLLDEIVRPKKHGEYGLFYPVTVDGQTEYAYVMCADCEDVTKLPDHLIKIEMPAATYAVFETPPADAANHGCETAIRDTWKFIFEQWLPASDYEYDESKIDFEYYDLRCHVETNSVMEIHVPVKKK